MSESGIKTAASGEAADGRRRRLGSLSGAAAADEADDFADDEHRAGHGGDGEPFAERKGHGAEDIATELGGQYLAEEDDGEDEEEAAVGKDAVHEAVVGAVDAGVEQVPELQHHEAGEEQGDGVAEGLGLKLLRGHALHVAHQGDDEADAEAENPAPHGGGDDEGKLVARLLLHHVVAGRL